MKAKTSLIVALGLGAFFGLSARGAEPPADGQGHVLLLDNDKVLEGQIERQDGYYRVRRGSSEIMVPAAKAVRLCAGWDEALAFLKARANLQDPDERLRLARWCHANGRLEQALQEAAAAVEMRPTDRAAQQFHALLRKQVEAAKHEAAAGHSSATSVFAPPPRVDVAAESLIV